MFKSFDQQCEKKFTFLLKLRMIIFYSILLLLISENHMHIVNSQLKFKISNGDLVRHNRNKFMVSLQYCVNPDRLRSYSNDYKNKETVSDHSSMDHIRSTCSHFCGGTILDSKHVLTAAHCLTALDSYSIHSLKILAGTKRLSNCNVNNFDTSNPDIHLYTNNRENVYDDDDENSNNIEKNNLKNKTKKSDNHNKKTEAIKRKIYENSSNNDYKCIWNNVRSFTTNGRYEKDRYSLINDIAIIEIDEEFDFETDYEYIDWIEVDQKNYRLQTSIHRNQKISGWGRIDENPNSNNDLLEASIPIKSNSYCSNRGVQNYMKYHLCGTDNNGIDSCKGDSGGPMFYENPNYPNKYIQTGIVSYGPSGTCGKNSNVVGIYTRLYNYIAWLTNHNVMLHNPENVIFSDDENHNENFNYDLQSHQSNSASDNNIEEISKDSSNVKNTYVPEINHTKSFLLFIIIVGLFYTTYMFLLIKNGCIC
jgi:secreted trypsin-like serine protease